MWSDNTDDAADETPAAEEPAAEEELVDVEEAPATPEGAVEDEEEPAVEEPAAEETVEEIPVEEQLTPEGAVEDEEEGEELGLDLVDTPQGDVLPQTGVLSAVVFYGLGAICIAVGGATLIKVRRKEEE